MQDKSRCTWPGSDPLYIKYHDEEWGVPVKDDRKLYEFLVLESFQAGLSWITILRKRENFRKAFAGFVPEKVACFTEKDITALMADAGIVRNQAKIRAAVNNAQAFLAVQKEFGTFHSYCMSFLEGRRQVNRFATTSDIPATTPVAEALAKDLKKRGFKFMGPTVVYAHMQAVGMVNDHIKTCFRHGEV